MWPSSRSSGVATDEAMISGLAPGSDAETEMVGEIDLRQRRDRQQLEGGEPREHQRDREQRGPRRDAG